MDRGEDGLTLLEVVIFLCFTAIVILPAYSYISNMAVLKEDSTRGRKDNNRVYEIVEAVKAIDTGLLLEGVEMDVDGYKVYAIGEYDRELEEYRKRQAERGEILFSYSELEIDIEVSRDGEHIAEMTVSRVEEAREEEDEIGD